MAHYGIPHFAERSVVHLTLRFSDGRSTKYNRRAGRFVPGRWKPGNFQRPFFFAQIRELDFTFQQPIAATRNANLADSSRSEFRRALICPSHD
jgi:hypothetical protein